MDRRPVAIDFFLDTVLVIRRHIEAIVMREPPECWRLGNRGDVILIPGFGQKWVFLRTVGNHLNTLGYRIHVVRTLGYNLSPIQQTAEITGKYIRENNLKDVVLVSHSKGGLVGKHLLDRSKIGNRIRLSVSIATPYGGTWAGYFQIFSLFELIPGSAFLQTSLNNSKNNQKILNFFAKKDNRIFPNSNAKIQGGTNIQVDVIGHTRILESQKLLEFLDENMGYTTTI